jgi:hypothetical protein
MRRRFPILLALAVLIAVAVVWPPYRSGALASPRSAAPMGKLKCKYGTKTVTKKVNGKKTKVKVCKPKAKKVTPTAVPTNTPTAVPTDTPTPMPTNTNTPLPTATNTSIPAAQAMAVAPTQETPQAATVQIPLLAPTVYPSGPNPTGVATGDFNHDGSPDIAVVNGGSNTLSVLINDGAGGFLPKVDYPTGSSPTSVTVADLSGDGYPDIIVANGGSNSISVYANNGDGTFAAPAGLMARARALHGAHGALPAGRPSAGRRPSSSTCPPGVGRPPSWAGMSTIPGSSARSNPEPGTSTRSGSRRTGIYCSGQALRSVRRSAGLPWGSLRPSSRETRPASR